MAVLRQWLFLAALSVACTVARADPGYYVVTAYDNQGVRAIDFRYWSVKAPNSPAVLWPEVGLGYGVTSRWYTELYASYIGSSDMPMKLSTLNWQNEFLLTQGNLPIDIALHGMLIRNVGYNGGSAVEYGPVFQTDIGRTQLNANIFFQTGWDQTYPAPTEMKYQWQVRYRYKPQFHFGAQGFGELGPWRHWLPRDQQSHRAGPAVFGSLPLGEGRALQFQAAYLVGSTYGQHANMFTMRVQFQF